METFTSGVAGVQTIITGDDGDIHQWRGRCSDYNNRCDEETLTSDVACVQTIITGDDGDIHQWRGRCSDYNNR